MPLQLVEGSLLLTTSGGYQNFHIDEQNRLLVRVDQVDVPHTLSGTQHLGQLSDSQIPDFITRDSELTAVSSTLQYQLDTHNHDDLYYGKTYLDNEFQDLEDYITTVSGLIPTEHDQLNGLGDDDHPQYHNDARGDARYYTKTLLDSGQLDNRYYTEIEIDNIISTTSGSLQTQIDGKSDIGHTHVEADITDLDKYTQTEVDGLLTTLSGYFEAGKADVDHTHVEDDILDLDKYTQAEVDALISTVSGSVITDHGALNGLGDDDHPQYHNDTRGDARYYLQSQVDTFLTTTSGDIVDQFLWELQAGYIVPKETTNNLRIYENVIIGGNLTVSGTQFITETEAVKVEDNIMTLNYGETGAGVIEGSAGIEIDRGTETYSRLLWDETNDYFIAGISGTEDPIALRESSPTNNYLAYWDNTNQIFSTAASINLNDVATESYVDNLVSTTSGTLQDQIDDLEAATYTVSGTSVINITIAAFQVPGIFSGVRPTYSIDGVVGVLLFDQGEQAHASFTIPEDFSDAADIEIHIGYFNASAQTGANNCTWNIDYRAYEINDVNGSKSDSSESVTDTLPNNASAQTYREPTLTLDRNDSNNPYGPGTSISFRIERDSGDTITGQAALSVFFINIPVNRDVI